MKQLLLFLIWFQLMGCNTTVNQDVTSHKFSDYLKHDSLITITKWVVYNSLYDKEVIIQSAHPKKTITFGELDYQVDTVITNNDTTVIVLSPYFQQSRLAFDDISEGYAIGLGFVEGSEMPYFFVDNRIGTRWYPQKPYLDIGDQPDSARLAEYIKGHEHTVNTWFKQEAWKRLKAH